MLPNWLYGKSLKKLQEILNSRGQTAEGVSYSNTDSGLEATNTQAAIDEIAEELDTKAAQSTVTTLSGKVTSMSSYLMHFNILPSSPASITIGAYGTAIILGMIQGIGAIAILIKIQGGAITNVINMIDGSDFSNDNISFSYSTNVLTITVASSSVSRITVIAGGASIIAEL